MTHYFKKNIGRSVVSFFVTVCFLSLSLCVPQGQAGEFKLPEPGVMVRLSPEFNFPYLRGMVLDKKDPFHLDFFVNRGEGVLSDINKKTEYQTLVKYFLAALAIPDEDQWVNLSPYENNRIIANDFAKTIMGRDLLAEDYMLKQITASLIYPEDKIGKKFWSRIYTQARQAWGTTDIPVNTFNKVWIVPEKALVYQNSKLGTVYILDSRLKVMLEEDYLSLSRHIKISSQPSDKTHALASRILREVVLPQLNQEVNTGKNFAALRQMYSAMILATWYKKVLKQSILAQIYADKAKVKGVDQDPVSNQLIYRRYLRAFKKGVYNYIKEEVDPVSHKAIDRKYFSGGFTRGATSNQVASSLHILDDAAQVSVQQKDSLANEALLGAIDQFSTQLSIRGPTVSLRVLKGPDFAMRALSYRGLGKVLLLTLVMFTACKSPKETTTPQMQNLFKQEMKLYHIQAPGNAEAGLNEVLRSFYNNNGKRLAPYKDLSHVEELLSGININGADPFEDIVYRVKTEISRLKVQNADPQLVDALGQEVVLWLQRMFVGVLNGTSPNYQANQPSVVRLIKGVDGSHTYNCYSISIAVSVLADRMGLNVSVQDVLEDEHGQRYPIQDASGNLVGHVNNRYGEHSLDQGGETHPHQVGKSQDIKGINADFEGALVLDKYLTLRATLKEQLDKASGLFKQNKFTEAQTAFTHIAKEANKGLADLTQSGIPDDFHPVNGVQTTVSQVKRNFEEIASVAGSNAKAAQQNAQATGQNVGLFGSAGRNNIFGAPSKAPVTKDDVDAYNREVEAHNKEAEAYNKLVNQINALNEKATDAFDHHKWAVAQEIYGQVIDLVKRSPYKDKLAKAIEIAQKNQEAAGHNASQSEQRDRDPAMRVMIHTDEVGGIDFNSSNLDLQMTGDSGIMFVPIGREVWNKVKILGLIPSIISIKPVSDWGLRV